MTAGDKPNIVTVYEQLGGRSVVPPGSRWRKVLCVLHEEREPSASINEDVGRYNCYCGCTDGKAVDSYELVMRKEGLTDFGEAQQRAWELAPSGDSVRGELDRGSRRVAPRKRDHPGGRHWVPAWRRG